MGVFWFFPKIGINHEQTQARLSEWPELASEWRKMDSEGNVRRRGVVNEGSSGYLRRLGYSVPKLSHALGYNIIGQTQAQTMLNIFPLVQSGSKVNLASDKLSRLRYPKYLWLIFLHKSSRPGVEGNAP